MGRPSHFVVLVKTSLERALESTYLGRYHDNNIQSLMNIYFKCSKLLRRLPDIELVPHRSRSIASPGAGRRADVVLPMAISLHKPDDTH